VNEEFESLDEISGEAGFNDFGEFEDFEPEEEGMSGFEAEGLYEDEFGEAEDFLEMEESGEEFFPALAGLLPILKTVAPMAIQAVGGLLGNMEGESLYEGDQDTPDEMAESAIPFLSEYNDMLSEELAGQAAETESESEAQSLAGGVTIPILTGAPIKIKKVAPVLLKKTGRLTRVLRKNRRTRPLVKLIPKIQKKTVSTLAKKAAKGKPITNKTAVRVMAKHTKKVLTKPKVAATALKVNKIKRKKLDLNKKAIARAERLVG